MAEVSRAHWIRLTVGCAAVLSGALAAPQFIPSPDLQENRILAEPPPPIRSLAELDAFREATDAYVADRLPPRTLLIASLNRARMLFGVSGSPRVIVGRDGWLFSDDATHLGSARNASPLATEAQVEWLAALAGRREAAEAEGAVYAILTPPLKETIYPEHGPRWFELAADRNAVVLAELARASGAGALIYPHADLRRQAEWGLKAYSRHDSHWTGLGAYHGYAALMRDLRRQGVGDGPRPLESFVEVNKDGAMKPRDLALMLGVASFVDIDHPELADPAPPPLAVTYLSERTDWTAPQVVDTGLEGKPVLLMTRDSFSNALLPFLYGHFSRIVLTHNQDGAWRPDLMERYRPDAVVTEVIESGLPTVMRDSPPASEAARARIRRAMAERARAAAEAARDPSAGQEMRTRGSGGPDRLRGGPGADAIHGRRGDDTIEGLGGGDRLWGGRGRDRIDAGPGDDWLSGDRDDDVLRGGRGADVFAAAEDGGQDIVEDFSPSEGDRVELELSGEFSVRQDGPDAVIEYRGGRLVLRGVVGADLAAGVVRRR